MTTELPQRSATIYQFPVGGRRAAAAPREQTPSVTDVRPQRAAAVSVGGAWYHDAAIQDGKRAGDR